VGIGGSRAETAIATALRRGVDEGVHIEFDPIDRISGEKYAAVLARTIEREGAKIAILGDSSSLWGTELIGQVGESIGWPALTHVTQIGDEQVARDITSTDERLAIQRKVDTGKQEVLTVDTPAVVGVDSGYANPERASIETVIDSQSRAIRKIPLDRVTPSETRFSMSVGNLQLKGVTPNDQWGSGSPPQAGTVQDRILTMLGRRGSESSSGELLDKPPEEAAEEVVDYLLSENLV
jgi:electron transfer flavoprotein alpha/beta subunit